MLRKKTRRIEHRLRNAQHISADYLSDRLFIMSALHQAHREQWPIRPCETLLHRWLAPLRTKHRLIRRPEEFQRLAMVSMRDLGQLSLARSCFIRGISSDRDVIGTEGFDQVI